MSEIKELFNTVVKGGYCIGCGACAAVEDSPIRMQMDKYGRYQAGLDNASSLSESKVLKVCPFSSESSNEDILGKQLFGEKCVYHNRIGYHLKTY